MAFSFFLAILLSPAALAEERLPSECARVPAYEQEISRYGVNSGHTKACRDAVAAIHGTWEQMRTAKSKVARPSAAGPAENQAGALRDAAEQSQSGSITKEQWARIATGAQNRFRAVSERLSKQIKLLERESSVVGGQAQISEANRNAFLLKSKAVLADIGRLKGTADSLAEEASKVSTDFQGDSDLLALHSRQTRDTAERLEGGDRREGKGKEKGISKNMMVGLGGAALITAGAVGGLYWVSTKTIDKANKAAEARIKQAEASANNVITNAENAAKRIIQFAYDSVSKVISNAEEAATRIYERAKSDVNKLIDDMRAEVQEAFENLTEKGLEKLRDELDSIFSGLIKKAQAEGNSKLAADLQKTFDSLSGQINSEIQRRQSGSASSTGTGTGTGSGTSTSTDTSTATSTETATATESSTSTGTSTGSLPPNIISPQ